MGSAFSKKSSTKAKPSEVDKAVLSLKTQRRKLAEYQKQVTSKIAEALEQAQVHVRQGNKQRATLALKQKRILQTRLGEIDGYLVNVEETLCNLDAARQNNKVFEALREGGAALKEVQSRVSVSALKDLVDDAEGAKEHEREVNAILQGDGVDLAEVEGELEQLERECEDEKALELGSEAAATEEEEGLDLPSVPAGLPKPEREPERGAAREEPRGTEPLLA
ncbi:vacuolar protein sorting-associated protein [Chloropicon roscoffensis]|uniref:Vacuolar protein sorting-associated protein n=1 Tax=Chloropicon roscoffensis TaxID=1461544 RepID=A0AAX4PJE7_9CHLO